MKRTGTFLSVLLLFVGLFFCVSGCRRPPEESSEERGPKTSFGKAVDSAKKLSGRKEERDRQLDEQARRAFE